jgi:hypothetical protein
MFMQTRLHMSPKRKKAQRAGFFVEAPQPGSAKLIPPSPPSKTNAPQGAFFISGISQACLGEFPEIKNDKHAV